MQHCPYDLNKGKEKRTAKAQAGRANCSRKVFSIRPDCWRVQNGDKNPYLVVRQDGAWACDCPDWTGRCQNSTLRCKHIEAVRLSPPASPTHTTSTQPQKEFTQSMTDEIPTTPLDPPDALATLAASLAAPFPSAAVNWKPQTLTKDKTRALAVAYIDARDVMDRLDDVVGQFNWQVEHIEACGQLVTRLGIRNPTSGEWVWKSDLGFVGGSESNNEDEQVKAIKGTPSDGLKRAGVAWGIGRYLYKLPKVWVDYDPDRHQLKATPVLPLWAMPPAERNSNGKTVRAPEAAANGNANGPSNGHEGDNGPTTAAVTENPSKPSPSGNGGTVSARVSTHSQRPAPDELTRARDLIMTMGSDTVRGRRLGDLGHDIWDYLATGHFTSDDGLALQKAARLLLQSPTTLNPN